MDNNNSWIHKYVGLPFVARGRDISGLDCWGLVRYIYQEELGVVLPDYADQYTNVTDSMNIVGVYGTEKGYWTKFKDPQPFDAIMFNIHGLPTHVGIVAFEDYFLHSPEDDFTRLERFTDRIWRNRVEGFYRHV